MVLSWRGRHVVGILIAVLFATTAASYPSGSYAPRYTPRYTVVPRYPVHPVTTAPPATSPPPAVPPTGMPGLPPPAGPKAWVLVDADTGNVINAFDDHTPMRPASISKLITAIAAVENLPADAVVPVSPVAAGAESVDLGMKPGQIWNFNDTLHAMLMLSANDAATALAERVSGTREAFSAELARTGAALHLADKPVLNDPAGLDDEFSVAGGNFISAYDLAIVARAALTVPAIRQIVALPEYRITAPDGVVHDFRSVNRGLELYPGSIGLKTGYTHAAGDTYMAAATRAGRTMIAIVLQSPDIYRSGAMLLDSGFAVPVSAESTADHLPPVSLPHPAPVLARRPTQAQVPAGGLAAATAPAHRSFLDRSFRQLAAIIAGAVLIAGGLAVVLWRRVARRRRTLFGP